MSRRPVDHEAALLRQTRIERKYARDGAALKPERIGKEVIVFANGGTLSVSHGLGKAAAVGMATAMLRGREVKSWVSRR